MPAKKDNNVVTCTACKKERPHFAFGQCKGCRNRFYERRARIAMYLETGTSPRQGIHPFCFLCGLPATGIVGEFVPYCEEHKDKVINIVKSHK